MPSYFCFGGSSRCNSRYGFIETVPNIIVLVNEKSNNSKWSWCIGLLLVFIAVFLSLQTIMCMCSKVYVRGSPSIVLLTIHSTVLFLNIARMYALDID